MAAQSHLESIWKDSMRIGIPIFDEQRCDLAKIIELLDTDPNHPITDEFFLGRFSVLQVMLSEFFTREESLMVELGIPNEVRERLAAEHDEVLKLLNLVYFDSMNKSTRNAQEVYLSIRESVTKIMVEHGRELHQYVPTST